MRSIVSSLNGPVFQDVETPVVAAECVLVKIKAAALNRADLDMATGGSHGAAGGIGFPLGLEWSGEIIEVGDGVTQWSVGDRVMGASPGAFSEFIIARLGWIYPIPDSLSFEEAAALPVALQTMHDAIVSNGQLTSGQSVLIQGASSAMGLMGMQIAKHLGASHIIGTSTSLERRDKLAEYGATHVIDTKADNWLKAVYKATRMKGVDVSIDLLAGPLVNTTLQATRVGGRMVNVGRMAGNAGLFDFDQHSMRRITYVGVTFRTRTPAEIMAVIARATEDLLPALASGAIKMPIDHVYRCDEYGTAFERMAQNKHFGKLVLTF